MIEIATASAVIGVLSSVVGLADSVFDTWSKFKNSGNIEQTVVREHNEKIEKTDDNSALIHSTNGRAAKKVTREDLSVILNESEVQVLNAVEKKMKILVSRWSSITAEYELVDANQKAIYKQRLDDICIELSGCLSQITTMLEKLGFELQDHYGAMKMIAQSRF